MANNPGEIEEDPAGPGGGRGPVGLGRASAWSAADVIGRQSVLLLVSMVLARVLTPADFGAVALASFFSAFVVAVAQQGLTTAIIQRDRLSDEQASSVFWCCLGASAVLAAVLAALGPAIAGYFELPVLAPLLMAAGAQVVLNGLGTVHSGILTRNLRFGDIAKAGIPATVVSGLLAVGLAFAGAGVWALAALTVSAAALNSLALWLLSNWRPRARLRAGDLGEMWRYARWVSLSEALEVAYSRGFAVILGKLYGFRDLGLYARAANTQQLPATIVATMIGRMALPLFAMRREEPAALRRGLLRANRLAMIVSLPALVGLALTSDLVMLVLFGPQWVEAGPVLSILAWAGTLYPLHAINIQLLLASGRSDLFVRLELTKKLVGIAAIVVGSFFGIEGLAWSQVAMSVIALAINAWPAGRIAGCGVAAQLADLKGIVLATALMAAAVLLCRSAVDLPDILELGVAAATGSLAFLVAGLGLRIHAFHEARDFLLGERPAKVAPQA